MTWASVSFDWTHVSVVLLEKRMCGLLAPLTLWRWNCARLPHTLRHDADESDIKRFQQKCFRAKMLLTFMFFTLWRTAALCGWTVCCHGLWIRVKQGWQMKTGNIITDASAFYLCVCTRRWVKTQTVCVNWRDRKGWVCELNALLHVSDFIPLHSY